MRYVIIEPLKREFHTVNAEELRSAQLMAGLNPLECDFGMVDEYTGIIVYEYSLINPKNGEYFSINRQLYNGNAVLFWCNEYGETIDAPDNPSLDVVFYDSIDEIERAIAAGKVHRLYENAVKNGSRRLNSE